MIIIPNKNEDLFVCYENVDYEKETYTTKVLNAKGENILKVFSNIEPIENSDGHESWYEENLLKYCDNNKYGLIDYNGNVILKAEYDNIYSLLGTQNNIIVEKDGKKGLVNAKLKKLVIAEEYASIELLSENYSDGYIVSNVSNLEIAGKGTIVALGGNETWATGLNFTNCKNITISDIDFTTSNNSEGDWSQLLIFTDCENVTIKNCTFKNCDVPLYFTNSKSVIVEDVEIKNTYIIYSDFSSVIFNGLESSNFTIFCSASESDLKFNNCKIKNSEEEYAYIIADYQGTAGSTFSSIEFSDCIIENNTVDAFFVKASESGEEYVHNGIKFKDCVFANNSYCNGDLNSSNFINCSFNNNTKLTSWTEETIQQVIQIHDVYVDDIDSAEGVDMRISWTNTSDKTIKYVHFYVVPYNAVGDPMYCDIRDYSRFDAYVTGPCEPGYEGYYKIGDIYYGNLWEDVWYNGSISTIELVGIKIIYMDGSVIDIAEKDVYKTFVEFSPLKEGYGVDEAFMEYYASEGNHRFFWSIDYLGISVRPNVNIDVRIVNSNNDEVFYGEYYAKSENFTEINMSGINKWMIATSVYDSEIKAGNSKKGTFYYHIWSEDGTIDLGWLSIEIDNLPTT